MNGIIFNKIRRILAEKDEAKRAEMMASSKLEFGEHFSRNLHDLQDLAFDLFQRAFADVQGGDLVSQLIEVKTVGLGDVDYIEEDLRGLRAYFQGKGGQIRSDVLRYERTTMPREELVAAIDMHQDEIRLEFWGTLSKLIAQVREKMRSAPAVQLIQLIDEANLAGQATGSFAAASVDSDDVDPIIDYVALRSGGAPTIFGTDVALRKFARIGVDWGDDIKKGIFQTGVIGSYKGRPIATLTNWEDFFGDFLIPNDRVWVIGKKAGRLTYYGSSPKTQVLPEKSFMQRWETAQDVGMSLYGAAKGRVGEIVFT